VKLGIEADARDYFAEIYSTDSTWAPRIAGVMSVEALSSLEKGQTAKGSRYILQAVDYDPSLDFGRHNALVGGLLLERRDYDGAIRFFSSYLEAYPDTAGAATVMMDLGSAYEGNGEALKAIELYRRFQQIYPKSKMKSTASWKLENLLLDSSVDLFKEGESEEAEGILTELAMTADNPIVKEKANFLLAEAFEARLDFGRAVYYYSEVINLNLGSSGRLAERAKERIVRIERARKNVR
jgi:TolA-binding protein